MNKYTVQVLSDKEYESLPYEGVSESDPTSDNYSYGCADVKRGMAFVRDTGNKEWNMATMEHEVNHLIEKHGKDHPDWESGILHKKGGFFRQIAAPLAGILGTVVGGPGLGALLGGLANAGFNTYAQSVHPEQLGAPSVLGTLGQGAMGAVEGYGAGNALQGGIAGGSEAGSGFLSKAGGIASGALVGTPAVAGTPSVGGLLGTGGKFLGIGAPATGTSLGSGTSALSSNVLAPGQAAANAASFGGPGSQLGVISQPTNLLGTTNAFNAATAVGSPEGIPGMSLTGGGVGTASGQPLLGAGSGFSPTGLAGAGDPAQAGLQSTLTNPNTGLASTIQPGAGLTTFEQQAPATSSSLVAPSGGAANAAGGVAKSGFDFSKILNGLTTGVGALGAGSALLGTSAALPSPQFQMPDSFGNLQTAIKNQQNGQAATPLGQTAQAALSKEISSPVGALSPALAQNDPYFQSTFATIDQNFQNAKAQLDASYNSAGQLGSGQYQDQLRQLTEQTAQDKNQIVSQENQRRFEIGQAQQFNAVQQALGVDQNTMADLAGLSGMDINVAAAKYGASVQDIQAIRQQLGTLGTSMVEKGLGLNAAPSMSINLLGAPAAK